MNNNKEVSVSLERRIRRRGALSSWLPPVASDDIPVVSAV